MFSTDRLEKCVQEYCRLYGISDAFQISEPWDIEAGYQHNLQFPDHAATGCYAIYSKDEELLYIGKASLNHTLGGRLDSHFMGVRSPAPGRTKDNKWETLPPPKYIRTIRVREPFEAPSLEEYLIRELGPLANKLKGARASNTTNGTDDVKKRR